MTLIEHLTLATDAAEAALTAWKHCRCESPSDCEHQQACAKAQSIVAALLEVVEDVDADDEPARAESLRDEIRAAEDRARMCDRRARNERWREFHWERVAEHHREQAARCQEQLRALMLPAGWRVIDGGLVSS